jgi:hypothetical protein
MQLRLFICTANAIAKEIGWATDNTESFSGEYIDQFIFEVKF